MGTSPDLRNVMQGVIDDSKSLGYTLPGEPLSRHKNLEAASKLRGAALVNKEELWLTDKYVKFFEEGHSKAAPAGGILLQAPARFPVSSWIALGAVRQSANLMCPKFLIPQGVSVRPFISWIS